MDGRIGRWIDGDRRVDVEMNGWVSGTFERKIRDARLPIGVASVMHVPLYVCMRVCTHVHAGTHDIFVCR